MSSKGGKLAIVGCGRWGINHVRTVFKIFPEKLRLVVDSNPEAEARVREISREIQFSTGMDLVLTDSSINSVIVATPAETHYRITKELLESGKNVLVEKPLTLSSVEARELIHLANKKKLQLMVGHVLLYHPAIRKLKQLIDEGEIGRIQYIYSNRLNLGTIRNEENILWSFAPHDISVIQYLIGRKPIQIEAHGAVFLQNDVEDTTLTYLSYPDNIHAHIYVSWLHPFKEQRLVVIGDRGMIVFEDSNPKDKLKFYKKGYSKVNGLLEKFDGDFESVYFEQEEPLVLEQKHFFECVENGCKPLTGGDQAIEVLEILEEAGRKLMSEKKKQIKKDFYVNEYAVVDDNVEIGEGTKVWHFSHIQSGARIGRYCTLGQNVNVANNVVIGNYVKIQNNVSVYEGVTLEDYVFCGPSMVFTNIKDPRSKYPQAGSKYYVRTLVKEGASLGANSTVVCGVTIGRYAFVGAGSVVTKDVPDFALVVGNPARIVGWVSEAGKKLEFDQDGYAFCEKSQKRYKFEDGRVIEV
ncbi:MAG: Gfo/Idh/MocA family oxidoreductase [Candidatus Kryptoniota bacterium]